MDQATQITQHLYLGALAVARDLSALEQLQISAIVCAAAEGRPHFPDKYDYLEMADLVEHDCGIDDIIQVLDEIYDFVSSRQVDNQNVLVHCVHGRTRSASIVTYILAKQHHGMSIQQAYDLIRSKRDIFIPEAWLDALQAKLSSEG